MNSRGKGGRKGRFEIKSTLKVKRRENTEDEE